LIANGPPLTQMHWITFTKALAANVETAPIRCLRNARAVVCLEERRPYVTLSGTNKRANLGSFSRVERRLKCHVCG
jgi:hypothetical protein